VRFNLRGQFFNLPTQPLSVRFSLGQFCGGLCRSESMSSLFERDVRILALNKNCRAIDI
jgi:hypothetical protein